MLGRPASLITFKNEERVLPKNYQAIVTNSPTVGLNTTSSVLRYWKVLHSSYGVARKSFADRCRIVLFATEDIIRKDERGGTEQTCLQNEDALIKSCRSWRVTKSTAGRKTGFCVSIVRIELGLQKRFPKGDS